MATTTHKMKGALKQLARRGVARGAPPELMREAAPAQVAPEAWRVPHGSTLFDEMLAFFAALRVPEGPLLGQPWSLLPYQVEAIRHLCDPTVRRIIISIPRKGGKTAFSAALVLAAICGPLARRNSSVYSAARSRDQAALVYNLAVKIINATPWLADEVVPTDSRKMLKGLRFNVEYRALAADSKRAHGLSPVFVIHDELGQVSGPTDDLYDALETAFGAQMAPKSLIISTQAAEDTDLLSTLIDDAIAANDPRTKVILYAAARNDDPWSERTWRKCHPAYGVFRNPVEFRDAADRAQRLPAAEVSFRRYYLNQRITGDTGFVTPNVWRANNLAPDPELFYDGRPVYGALDLSSKQDLTAAAFVCEDDDLNAHLLLKVWTPGATLNDRAQRDRTPYHAWRDAGVLTVTPGASVSYAHVVSDMASFVDGMNLQAVAYDRWRIEEFKRECARAGVEFPLIECGQGFKDMSPRIEATIELLLNHSVRHGGHPVLTAAASSATVTTDPAGNKKLDKSRATGRIDPLVAMVMAIGQMRRSVEEASDVLPIIIWGGADARR